MEYIATYLPWLLSAITIWMTVLAGNKHRLAWLVGLVNQALWLVWIITTGTWGLLPMNFALSIVYGRNHLKWTAEKPEQPEPYVPAICNPHSSVRGMRWDDYNQKWVPEADARSL